MAGIGIVLVVWVLLIILLRMEVVRIMLVVVPAVACASSIPGGELVACWAQRTESMVRIDPQPLVIVAATRMQILPPVMRTNRVMLRATIDLLIALQAAASKYLPPK